jgi:hypothetical protein
MASPSNVIPMNRKITLPAVSWKIIKELLNAPGWASTPRDITVAGRIDYTDFFKLPPLPNAKDPSKPITPEQDRKWCDKEIEFELMDKQVEVIKKCLTHFIGQKNVNPSKYALKLVEAFVPEE